MGLILCERHGPQGIAFVCPHLVQAVVRGEPLARPVPIGCDWDEETWRVWVHLCPKCAAHEGCALTGEVLHGDAGLDRIFEILQGKPAVCTCCFDECYRASGEMK